MVVRSSPVRSPRHLSGSHQRPSNRQELFAPFAPHRLAVQLLELIKRIADCFRGRSDGGFAVAVGAADRFGHERNQCICQGVRLAWRSRRACAAFPSRRAISSPMAARCRLPGGRAIRQSWPRSRPLVFRSRDSCACRVSDRPAQEAGRLYYWRTAAKLGVLSSAGFYCNCRN